MTSKPHTYERAVEINKQLEETFNPKIEEFLNVVGVFPTTIFVNLEIWEYIATGVAMHHPYQGIEGNTELVFSTGTCQVKIRPSSKKPKEPGYYVLSSDELERDDLTDAKVDRILLGVDA